MLMSLAFVSPQHTVQGSTEILGEVLHLVKPENLETFIADADLGRFRKTVDTCNLLRDEIDAYANGAGSDARRQEVLDHLSRLLTLIGQATQQLVDLPLGQPWTPGAVAIRHDAFTWFSVMGDVVEDGVTDHLLSHIEEAESSAIQISVNDYADSVVTPPPGFENDPAFLKRMADANVEINRQIGLAHQMSSYVISQCQAMRELHTLHVLVNRD